MLLSEIVCPKRVVSAVSIICNTIQISLVIPQTVPSRQHLLSMLLVYQRLSLTHVDVHCCIYSSMEAN